MGIGDGSSLSTQPSVANKRNTHGKICRNFSRNMQTRAHRRLGYKLTSAVCVRRRTLGWTRLPERALTSRNKLAVYHGIPMALTAVHTIASVGRAAGGPVYSVTRLCDSLASAGANVELVTLASPDGPSEAVLPASDGVKVHFAKADIFAGRRSAYGA